MTGTPAGTAVPDAEVLACPAAQPYLALEFSPTCVLTETPLVADYT